MLIGYFKWFYFTGIGDYVGFFRNLAGFFWNYFSVKILCKTLVSPWRRDVYFSNWRGLHPVLFLRKLANNIFSRLMGLLVRLPLVFLGCSASLLVAAIGVVLFIPWALLPAALPISFYLFFSNVGSYYFSEIIFGGLLAAYFWLFAISISNYFEAKENGLAELNLEKLAKKKWFARVWNRLGFAGADSALKDAFSDMGLLEKKLNDIGVGLDGFLGVVEFELRRWRKNNKQFSFWRRERLDSITPIGRNWMYAYTVNLDKFSEELPEGGLSYKDSYLMGRKKDIEMIELILSRRIQNNLVLLGEPGIGKMTLINLLAKKIKEGYSNGALNYKRVVKLNVDQILSGSGGDPQAATLHKIFQEAVYAGNVIMVIENLSSLPDDILKIVKDYAAYPAFRIIGTDTSEGFHSGLEKNSLLMKNFDKVIMAEPSREDIKIALLYVFEREEARQVIFTLPAINEIVNLADQYATEVPEPERSIDLAEEAVLFWARNSSHKFLLKEDVDHFFSQKMKLPLDSLGADEKKILANLENILHRRVIGQNEAVAQITEAIIRTRSGISDSTKPAGSFLFFGSTGVGKTESAKALAEAYFGEEDKMIRLDMSEFQLPDSVERILGSEKTGLVAPFISKVKENPFSVLLLDEVEKAYPDILNLLLQVLDEGWLTDAFGKKIIFKNMIIIATSNAGSEIIKEGIESGKGSAEIQAEVIDYVTKQGIFRTELLNRFEKLIFFKPLNSEELIQATSLMLNVLAGRIFSKKKIKILFEDNLAEKIISRGYNPIFGARSIKHFIQDKMEDLIAKKIIFDGVAEGGSIKLTERDI